MRALFKYEYSNVSMCKRYDVRNVLIKSRIVLIKNLKTTWQNIEKSNHDIIHCMIKK